MDLKLVVKNYWYYAVPILICGLVSFFLISQRNQHRENAQVDLVEDHNADTTKTSSFYGMRVTEDHLHFDTIAPNEYLSDILLRHDVDYPMIHKIATEFDSIFDVSRIKAGQPYCVIGDEGDSTFEAKCFVYEENLVDYVIISLNDEPSVERGKKPIDTIYKEASGVITSSLYQTMVDNEIDPMLAIRMSEVYAWSIDFYHLQQNDKFKITYYEEQVNGHSLGVQHINSALFVHREKDHYAFKYRLDSLPFGSYYDEEGRSLRNTFLQAPVAYSRISSGYTTSRKHPVTGVTKAHLGTDYAAPTGTPIVSTADGVVTEARFKQYNGNYVKVKHNGTYTTQYLHMSKIASGISPGVAVEQGEVIGYVGSTGLATGPHVCYRFWKNGVQVDPYKEDLPKSPPIVDSLLPAYLEFMEPLKAILDAVPYPSEDSEETSTIASIKEEEITPTTP